MTGSGNDFVMVDARVSNPGDWTPAEMAAVCARGTGVGADGVVFVGPGSASGAVRMIYFNSDGSHAAMCGNAALCSTRLAARLGFADPRGMRLETDSGTFPSRAPGELERAELNLPPAAAPATPQGMSLATGERQAVLGVVGVPHLVVLVENVDQVEVGTRGRALRFDPSLGPPGANVNFISPGAAAGEWRMRTYERGVEGETLACGTGAVTAACALIGWELGRSPIRVLTRSGRVLDVSVRPNGIQFDDVWLGGEARLVFRGVLA